MVDRTLNELQYLQAMPLNIKVKLTKSRIRDWINTYGEDGVYISFSGGKDSTVLLDIVRQDYPDVTAMFVDVPTQYPELKEFAMQFPNVDIVKPEMNFFQVCERYGFPLISKEVSESVAGARSYMRSVAENGDDSKAKYRYFYNKIMGIEQYDKQSGSRSTYGLTKYKFLLDSDFEISNQCCRVMKKTPSHIYHRKTGKNPITGQMASESLIRTQKWLQHGCNGFDLKIPTSNPMSFWTEQDVLLYIKIHNLPICSVYGEVVVDSELDGQLSVFDVFEESELFEKDAPVLKTTGCDRTGCVLCGFGCHLNDDQRFVNLRKTHPQWYRMLDIAKNNGITYRQAIEWLKENGNLKINL